MSVEETEKWMEEAMQMVRSLGGGCRGWELPTVLIPTLSVEQTSRVLSHHHNLDGLHALWVAGFTALRFDRAHSHRGFGGGREEIQKVFFTEMKYAPNIPIQLLLARTCYSPFFPVDTLANARSHIMLYL